MSLFILSVGLSSLILVARAARTAEPRATAAAARRTRPPQSPLRAR